jgi:ABC-type transporter Mla subunit MlaD
MWREETWQHRYAVLRQENLTLQHRLHLLESAKATTKATTTATTKATTKAMIKETNVAATVEALRGIIKEREVEVEEGRESYKELQTTLEGSQAKLAASVVALKQTQACLRASMHRIRHLEDQLRLSRLIMKETQQVSSARDLHQPPSWRVF